MREYSQRDSAGSTADAASAQPEVGRSTLADQPGALETIYGDHRHDAHAAPFEHHANHAERHWAKEDRFNRGGIHSDPTTVRSAGRPGVIEHGHGVFLINKPEVTRYTFVRQGKTNVARPFDVIERDKLSAINYKAQGKSSDAHHHTERVLANPSQPRHLEIDGRSALCVLTWVDGLGAAWMRVADLKDGDKIEHAAAARAHREDPAAAYHDPEQLLHHTQRFVIRNDQVGEANAGDAPHGKERVLGPGEKGGDNVSHYLVHDQRKPGFDASGKPLGSNVTRSFVAICMNLPEHGVPPIALDTALAGDSFFAMRDRSFYRQVAVYANGAHRSNLEETWVFGHLAMQDATGKQLPDPARRGWVPLRVLAQASQLVLKDVPQRS